MHLFLLLCGKLVLVCVDADAAIWAAGWFDIVSGAVLTAVAGVSAVAVMWAVM